MSYPAPYFKAPQVHRLGSQYPNGAPMYPGETVLIWMHVPALGVSLLVSMEHVTK